MFAVRNSYTVIDGKGSMTSLSGTTLVLSAISEGHLYGTWYQPKDGFQESDLKWKYDIEDLNAKYSEMFDYLRPVRYKYKHGTSGRYHTGLIAQEVKYAIEKAGMTTKEVASYGENILQNSDERDCYLRYGELIALCVREIQLLKAQMKK